jgi:preprotein translocase subunit Sec61beta
MAEKDKVYMPSGMGGLLRFGEEEEPKFKIKPKHLIYAIAGVVTFELIARFLIF